MFLPRNQYFPQTHPRVPAPRKLSSNQMEPRTHLQPAKHGVRGVHDQAGQGRVSKFRLAHLRQTRLSRAQRVRRAPTNPHRPCPRCGPFCASCLEAQRPLPAAPNKTGTPADWPPGASPCCACSSKEEGPHYKPTLFIAVENALMRHVLSASHKSATRKAFPRGALENP